MIVMMMMSMMMMMMMMMMIMMVMVMMIMMIMMMFKDDSKGTFQLVLYNIMIMKINDRITKFYFLLLL